MKTILFILASVLSGCATAPNTTLENSLPTTTTTQPVIESVVYQKLAWPQIEYTKILYSVLKDSTLIGTSPKDLKEFCPKITKTDIHFWAQLMSAMAKRESNFKTETTYKESFKDQKGEYVISRGLLQISIESGKAYNKALKAAQELHDPKVNLQTGKLILERWVLKDNYIGGTETANVGAGRYFSVLRKNRGDSRVWIEDYMKALPMCR